MQNGPAHTVWGSGRCCELASGDYVFVFEEIIDCLLTGRSSAKKYFQCKQSPTADDKKSATVCHREPTAKKYKNVGLLYLAK